MWGLSNVMHLFSTYLSSLSCAPDHGLPEMSDLGVSNLKCSQWGKDMESANY